jgi:hypothetical protein
LILQILKQYIWSDSLKENGRMSIKDFVRERVLTFPVLLLFLINSAKQTLQISLDNFFETIKLSSVTKQAFSKARKKLLAKAFVLLNRKLLEEYYTDNTISLWKGFRLIAIDGSDIQLPQKESLISRFGCAKNTKNTLAMAKLSCAYDILNCKTLDAQLDRCKSPERDLAFRNIEAISSLNQDPTNDLYIFDRGYPSLGMFFYLKNKNADFLMRGSFSSCFSSIKKRLEDGETDFIHRLLAKQATHQQAQDIKEKTPLLDRKTAFVDVRVTVVILDNGEKELLFSSLLDKIKYSTADLKQLYGRRWDKEENYKWFKIGLELENFSGHSEKAVEQEIWALIFTANTASLIMQDAQEEVDQEHGIKGLKHSYKINKKIAIGSLKDNLIKVLYEKDGDITEFCDRLKKKFKKNLCPVREGRKYKRVKKARRKYGCTLRRCL